MDDTVTAMGRVDVRRIIREVASARGRDDGDAELLFEKLLGGSARVIDRFETGSSRYLVAVETGRDQRDRAAIVSLTPRERQIFRLAAAGRSVKSIAFDIDVQPSTAARYLVDACRKTGVRSRAELIRWFSRCAG
jgi:DNA-binding CsgD family transcriptional regulator